MEYIKEDIENAKQELKDYIYNKKWVEERLSLQKSEFYKNMKGKRKYV